MVDVSLPVRLSVPPNDLLIDFNRRTGVSFSFSNATSDENKEILAIFMGALYWVDGGSILPVLPTFNPASDSIIFEPLFTNVTCREKICYPFPKFITYENLNKEKVRAYMSENVSSIFSWSNDDLLDEFFNNGEKLFCDGGSPLGHPENLANVIDPNFPVGFSLRTWKDANNELIYPHVYLHHLRFIETSIPSSNVVYDLLPYGISNSVGRNGNNALDDIYIIKQRLYDLGFTHSVTPNEATWVGGNPPNIVQMTIDSNSDAVLIGIIRLFQAIIHGERSVSTGVATYPIGVDGRIDRGGTTERWLWASNTPTWSRLESDPDNGYQNDLVNTTLTQNFDYGTNYLKSTIEKAAEYFLRNWWDNLTQAQKAQRNNIALIRSAHASTQGGGDNSSHIGHETGLDVDIRLCNLDGSAGGCWNADCANDSIANNPRITAPAYDREATRAICTVFSSLSEVRRIFFNDPTINSNAVNLNPPGTPVDKVFHQKFHHHHLHVDVNPPNTPTPDLTIP